MSESKKKTRTGPGLGELRRRARRLALQALYQWQVSKTSASQIEAQFVVDNDMSKVDTAYFRELLQGITKAHQKLDEVLMPYLDRPVKDLDPIELALVRMGGFELTERLDVPYRVAINEAVELAKKFGGTDGHKFVNGILDKVAAQYREVEIKAGHSSSKETDD